MERDDLWNSPAITSVFLIVLGSVAAVLYFLTLSLGNLENNFVSFEIVFFSLFGFYLLAVYISYKQEIEAKEILIIIVLFALIFRLILLATTPSLSTDIFRYLWDGRIQRAGINPYRYAPSANALSAYRDGLVYEYIYRPDIPTIYPPLSEFFFLLVQLIRSNSILAFKWLITLVDLFSIGLILFFLKARNLNPANVIFYAWSPLVIFEFAHSGHIDALLIPLVILAVWFRIKDKDMASGSFLGLATLVKLYPAFLIFGLVGKKNWRFLFCFILTVLVGYIPYAGVGVKVLGSLGVYLKGWGGGLLGGFISWGLSSYFGISRQIATALVLFILALTGGLIAFRIWRNDKRQYSSSEETITWIILLIGLFVLLSPSIYPWYAIWIIPFLCFRPSIFWLALTGVVALLYLTAI